MAKMRAKMAKMRAKMAKMRPKMGKMRPKMPKMRAKMAKIAKQKKNRVFCRFLKRKSNLCMHGGPFQEKSASLRLGARSRTIPPLELPPL